MVERQRLVKERCVQQVVWSPMVASMRHLPHKQELPGESPGWVLRHLVKKAKEGRGCLNI